MCMTYNFSRVQDYWLIQYLLILTFPTLITGSQMLILCFPTARVIKVQRIDWLWSNPGASEMEGEDWGRTKQFLTFELKLCSVLVDIHQYVCNVLLYPRIIQMHSPSLYWTFFWERIARIVPCQCQSRHIHIRGGKMTPCFEVTLTKSELEWFYDYSHHWSVGLWWVITLSLMRTNWSIMTFYSQENLKMFSVVSWRETYAKTNQFISVQNSWQLSPWNVNNHGV